MKWFRIKPIKKETVHFSVFAACSQQRKILLIDKNKYVVKMLRTGMMGVRTNWQAQSQSQNTKHTITALVHSVEFIIIVRAWLLLLRWFVLRSICCRCQYFVSCVNNSSFFPTNDSAISLDLSYSLNQHIICLRLNCVHTTHSTYFQLPRPAYIFICITDIWLLRSLSRSLASLIKIIAIIDHLLKHIIIIIILLLLLPPSWWHHGMQLTVTPINQATSKPTKRAP